MLRQKAVKRFVFVGSFVMPNPPEHEGLHVFHVEPETGDLTAVASYVPGLNVGGFAIDKKRGILYATDEVASTAEFREKYGALGGGGGRIFAFSIDRKTGTLTELGRWPSYGTQPAGVALDATGNFLVVSHFTSRASTTAIVGNAITGYRIEPRYDDATTVLFPIDAEGCLGEPTSIHIHESENAAQLSCLHSVTLSTDGSFFVECDMKKDRVNIFVVDLAAKSLRLQDVHQADPGSGPRYSAFHPRMPIFYVNYEYSPVIEAFSFSPGGRFTSLGTVKVLPKDLEAKVVSGVLLSDLCVHPSGKYVYTLVRGHNIVSGFTVDIATGRLQQTHIAKLDGISPKGCAVSPDGRFLYVATSVTNAVHVWKIDEEGRLSSCSSKVEVPRPSAIKVVEL